MTKKTKAVFVGGPLDGLETMVDDGEHQVRTLPSLGDAADVRLDAEPRNEPVPLIVYQRCERINRPGQDPVWIYRLTAEATMKRHTVTIDGRDYIMAPSGAEWHQPEHGFEWRPSHKTLADCGYRGWPVAPWCEVEERLVKSALGEEDGP